MKILVVDDDSVSRITSRAALESLGHEVIEKDSGFGTGSLVLKEKPDVLLLDLEMPGLSGDKVVDSLRKCSDESYSPMIIFHSGRDALDLNRIVLETGVDGFIGKRGNVSDFISSFERLVAGLKA